MSWQRIVYLLIIISSFNTYSGGVDVGNGGLTMSYDILIDRGFRSEAELTNFLDESKYRIESGEEFNLSILIQQYKCDQKIKMQHMSVEEFYPHKQGTIMPKEFKGLLKLNLVNCKTKQ